MFYNIRRFAGLDKVDMEKYLLLVERFESQKRVVVCIGDTWMFVAQRLK